jgi:hypothetical protein
MPSERALCPDKPLYKWELRERERESVLPPLDIEPSVEMPKPSQPPTCVE